MLQKNALKSTKMHGSKGNMNLLADANISINTNTGMEVGDSNLCQLPQVNLQQHALSIQHICKVKKLLEQSTVDGKPNIETEDDKYSNKQISNAVVNVCKDVTSVAQAGNLKTHVVTDIADSDRLGTFTRIYKELKLQNTMKQVIDYTCNNQGNELKEWHELSNMHDEADGETTKNNDAKRFKVQRQQQASAQTAAKNYDGPASVDVINMANNATEQVDSMPNSNGNENGSQCVLAQDYQHFKKLNNIANHKVMTAQYNINDSKSANFFSNAPLATSITDDDDDNYMDEYKDSNGGNTVEHTEVIQNPSTRNETTTANSNSSSSSSTLTTHSHLTNAHTKDIIQQLFKCNEITGEFYETHAAEQYS